MRDFVLEDEGDVVVEDRNRVVVIDMGFETRAGHGYRSHRVWVRVTIFGPTLNPYPWPGYTGIGMAI